MNTTEIVTAITTGAADDELDEVDDALRLRRKHRRQIDGAANRSALAVGDRVAFCGDIGPRYLVGITGTVAAIGQRISVDVDALPAARRYSGVKDLRVPADLVEAL